VAVADSRQTTSSANSCTTGFTTAANPGNLFAAGDHTTITDRRVPSGARLRESSPGGPRWTPCRGQPAGLRRSRRRFLSRHWEEFREVRQAVGVDGQVVRVLVGGGDLLGEFRATRRQQGRGIAGRQRRDRGLSRPGIDDCHLRRTHTANSKTSRASCTSQGGRPRLSSARLHYPHPHCRVAERDVRFLGQQSVSGRTAPVRRVATALMSWSSVLAVVIAWWSSVRRTRAAAGCSPPRDTNRVTGHSGLHPELPSPRVGSSREEVSWRLDFAVEDLAGGAFG